MNNKIIITGGSGFIGRNLKEYLQDKYKIFAPTHQELDLLDGGKVLDYIRKNKIDIIIHAASKGGGRDTVGLQEVVETNLRMFFNVARCEGLVAKIISFGSGAEYDKSRALVGVNEKDFDRYVPSDDYGFYKYVCSKYILKSDEMICLRLFGVYGKYENYLFKFISNAIVKNLLKMPIVIGQNVNFDYLYIDDLVEIVEYFINHTAMHKDYNIGTGLRADLLTISELINKVSDYQSEITVKNKGFNLEYTADNSRLRREIPGYKFTKIEEGIKRLYRWYKIHLTEINKKKVREDPYLRYINTHKASSD